MEITNVTVRKLENSESNVKGISTIVLNDEFAIHDIRIIEGQNGLFIAMPSRKTNQGEYRDVVHPIKKEVRELVHNTIIEAYKKEVQE